MREKPKANPTSYSLPRREPNPPPSCTLLHPSLRAHSRSQARFRILRFLHAPIEDLEELLTVDDDPRFLMSEQHL